MNVFSKAAGLAMLFAGLAGSVCAQQPLLLSLERMFELAEKQNRSDLLPVLRRLWFVHHVTTQKQEA